MAEGEEIHYVYCTKLPFNSETVSEVYSTAIHSFFYLKKNHGERNTGLSASTAPSYKEPNNLLQLQNTQLNLLTVTLLSI